MIRTSTPSCSSTTQSTHWWVAFSQKYFKIIQKTPLQRHLWARWHQPPGTSISIVWSQRQGEKRLDCYPGKSRLISCRHLRILMLRLLLQLLSPSPWSGILLRGSSQLTRIRWSPYKFSWNDSFPQIASNPEGHLRLWKGVYKMIESQYGDKTFPSFVKWLVGWKVMLEIPF